MDIFVIGINLYKTLKKCIYEDKDITRAKRLKSRLDTYYHNLNRNQKKKFVEILINQKLITGTLVDVIKTFSAEIEKISEVV